MKNQAWLCAALAGFTFAVGCGDDGGSSGPTLDALPPLLAEELCDAYLRCLGPATPKGLSQDACVATNTASIDDGSFQYVQGAVDAGRVRYNGASARACLDALSTSACTAIGSGDLPAVCDSAIIGTIAIGDPCAIDEECEGDAFCMMGTTCPGTCTALRAAAETCKDDDECADGLSCSATGRCTTKATAGTVCGGANGPECALGLICAGEDKDMGVSGECTAISEVFVGDVGDTCSLTDGTFCKEGVSCAATITGSGATTMVVWACEAELAANADCKLAIPDQCPADQFCDVNPEGTVPTFAGTCTNLPRAGQECSAWQKVCADGTVCDKDGICQPINRIGGACNDESQCASATCNGTTCVAPELCSL